MDDEKFRDRAERQIFAATMKSRARQYPWESPDNAAQRAWAMVQKYRSRCPAHNGCPTVEEAAANDGGPTEADLRGEVDYVADHDKWVDELASEIEWEPLRNFVLRLKADPGGEVDHE